MQRKQTSSLLNGHELSVQTINDLLGLHSVDFMARDRRGSQNVKNLFSHCHPFGGVSIKELTLNQLVTIMVNYDADRTRSKVYLRPDRVNSDITTLLNELAYAIMFKIADKTATENFNLTNNTVHAVDLANLNAAITQSTDYLAKNESMQQLQKLVSEILAEFTVSSQINNNVSYRNQDNTLFSNRAQLQAGAGHSYKVDTAIKDSGILSSVFVL